MDTHPSPARRPRSWWICGVIVSLAVVAAGCSGSDGSDGRDGGPAPTVTTRPDSDTTTAAPARDVPEGPAAELADLPEGNGTFLAAGAQGSSLEDAGYEELEVAASGTATSYSSEGDLPTDGRFDLQPDEEADYATRLVVRRPKDPADFDGTVVVEWLNVSGGLDAAPEYTYTAPEILRRGSVWVGVSAQRIGIEGGTVAVEAPGTEDSGAGKGLKAIDPVRYGALHHPGDAYSYDIFSQVGRAARHAADGGPSPGSTSRRSWQPANRSRRSPSPPTSTASSRSPACSTASWCTAGAARPHRCRPRAGRSTSPVRWAGSRRSSATTSTCRR